MILSFGDRCKGAIFFFGLSVIGENGFLYLGDTHFRYVSRGNAESVKCFGGVEVVYLFKIFFTGGDEVPGHVDGARAHHEAVVALAKELAGAVLDAWKNSKYPLVVFVFAK